MNNLQKRLVDFAVEISLMAKDLKSDSLMIDCLRQVIRSSTSAGANYSESQSANSNRDFHNKIRISLKELKETNFWLSYLERLSPENVKIPGLINESVELMKIMGTISKNTDPNRKPINR
jgi:four helix bundle protein